MDYCHPCRRHLNGALACPGCGTPAHELRASGDSLAGGEGVEPRFGARAAAAGGSLPEDPGERLDEDPDDGAGDATPGARSSRRDRKAATHRRRRRRTLLVAAGFVLAAGGLSLAELGTDAPHSPATPTSAGDETADGTSTREVGEASAIPVGDASGPAPSGAASSPGVSASASASVSSSASASAAPSASASASRSPDAEEQDPATGTGAPSAPLAPETTPAPDQPPPPPDDPPATAPSAPATSPAPAPTKTCDRFLWWCT
ncbi:hypothetical protein ACIRFH_08495 [Streptomyces sp. NPDC093586]|uniref:SCO2400 family protein n=1 Tax=Streptomyces sp. NPDC093586 TaxID=3366042 RepID=UPI0037FDCE6D